MKVSYFITCKDERDKFGFLMEKVVGAIDLDKDQIVILVDPKAPGEHPIDEDVAKIIGKYGKYSNITWCSHHLNNDFGAHKNFGIEKCYGDFIFQLDGDELPPETLLGENLHALLESNPTVEAYAVPRINDFKGVTVEHAKQWGWRLTESPLYKRPIVNFPDYQWRIFKRDYPRISFTRRLHEKIEGYDSYVTLPADEDYALYHDKTIEKQIETNLKYNKMFSKDENRGHSVFK